MSLPAVMISSPSEHGSGSYGNRLGWLLPIRNGTTPPATKAPVWFTRPDMADASRLISTCWPRPVSCLWLSAARIPMVACRPEITSNTATPARYGSPSGSPVTLISPEVAWTMRSYPGSAAPLGPLPKPLIEAYTTAGLAAETES